MGLEFYWLGSRWGEICDMKRSSMKTESKKRTFGCSQVLIIVLVAMLVSAGLTFWWVKRNLYPKDFTPVALSQVEKEVLDEKVKKLEEIADGRLTPEEYDDSTGSKVIDLTERELNYLIVKDSPELAEKIAVKLTKNLVSLKIVTTVDEDSPFELLAGRKIRVNVGLKVDFDSPQPEISLKGVTLGGISLPSEWLGNLKNKNLIDDLKEGDEMGKILAGVKSLKVEDGKVRMELKD
jgi:hypothetical protein